MASSLGHSDVSRFSSASGIKANDDSSSSHLSLCIISSWWRLFSIYSYTCEHPTCSSTASPSSSPSPTSSLASSPPRPSPSQHPCANCHGRRTGSTSYTQPTPTAGMEAISKSRNTRPTGATTSPSATTCGNGQMTTDRTCW